MEYLEFSRREAATKGRCASGSTVEGASRTTFHSQGMENLIRVAGGNIRASIDS